MNEANTVLTKTDMKAPRRGHWNTRVFSLSRGHLKGKAGARAPRPTASESLSLTRYLTPPAPGRDEASRKPALGNRAVTTFQRVKGAGA